jgi:hypothetical protein
MSNNQYIITTDGTVVKASECFIVDLDLLSDEDVDTVSYGSDEEVAELGQRIGMRVEA